MRTLLIALLCWILPFLTHGQESVIISQINETVAAINSRTDLLALTRIDTLGHRNDRTLMIRQQTYYYEGKKQLHKVVSEVQLGWSESGYRSLSTASYFSNKKLLKQEIRRNSVGGEEVKDCYIIKGKLVVSGDDIPIESWMIINDDKYYHSRFKWMRQSLYPVSSFHPTKRPGTASLSEKLSMNRTEVTISEWMAFIINNGFDGALFPDSSKMSEAAKELFVDLKKGKDFTYLTIISNGKGLRADEGNFSVRASGNFKNLTEKYKSTFPILFLPVTGITYDQAVLYCKWKEGMLNRQRYIRFEVDLPSIEMYQKVITNIDSVNVEGCPRFNWQNCSCKLWTKGKGKLVPDLEHGKALVRADGYWPTELGLYNLQGNAAEMTSTPGVAMGGSFRHYAKESHSNSKQLYSSAEEWLGFRYVITVK